MEAADLRARDLTEDEIIQIFARASFLPPPLLPPPLLPPATSSVSTIGSPSGLIVVPNGDDAAAWQTPAHEVSVLSTDTLVEGVHFDLAWEEPRRLGRKMIAVNLSDLAAMGARPAYVFLSICVPPSMRYAQLVGIADGVHEICCEYDVSVLGGNVTRAPTSLVLGVTVVGHARPEHLVRRTGASSGDLLFVTGTLGDARAGLASLQAQERDMAPRLVEAQLNPIPRVEAGRRLAESGLVRAMCDLSDGFLSDVRRLLSGAALGATIDLASLPISADLRAFAARRGTSADDEALMGGEEYELLFVVAPEDKPRIFALLASVAPVSCVGVVDATGVVKAELNGDIRPLPSGGFSHFSRRLD
ncbi:MAG: thiamine-phosphate kinase [Deltaproteobacteria bacterium]|nr:thiamine-phosphate kinase [Deltaproteobacteria bacterium]